MKTREEIAERLAASGYIADGELATAISLMQLLRRPLLLGRRGGRRQDRGRQGAGRGSRHRADPAAMLRGARSIGRALRMELPAAAARDPGASRRGCRRDRGSDLLGKVSAGTAAAGRDPPRQAAGVADRRDRPSRRRVRGVPARTACPTFRCRYRNWGRFRRPRSRTWS